MKTLTIRGIDDEVSGKLKEKARKENASINQTVVHLLKQGLGIESEPVFKQYNDLNDLAGTWTKDDLMEFTRDTKDFSKIDRSLWK